MKPRFFPDDKTREAMHSLHKEFGRQFEFADLWLERGGQEIWEENLADKKWHYYISEIGETIDMDYLRAYPEYDVTVILHLDVNGLSDNQKRKLIGTLQEIIKDKQVKLSIGGDLKQELKMEDFFNSSELYIRPLDKQGQEFIFALVEQSLTELHPTPARRHSVSEDKTERKKDARRKSLGESPDKIPDPSMWSTYGNEGASLPRSHSPSGKEKSPRKK